MPGPVTRVRTRRIFAWLEPAVNTTRYLTNVAATSAPFD
ncbi:MAG: hypothetical protein QOJ64_795 [Acidobacteriota bacterium]|nr:hypothetical protein [Acidobacteriota bacterium]